LFALPIYKNRDQKYLPIKSKKYKTH
jgi:hypothetical protein